MTFFCEDGQVFDVMPEKYDNTVSTTDDVQFANVFKTASGSNSGVLHITVDDVWRDKRQDSEVSKLVYKITKSARLSRYHC
jgi:hypothetical protein